MCSSFEKSAFHNLDIDRRIVVCSARMLPWIKAVIRACADLSYLTILPGLQLAERQAGPAGSVPRRTEE